jgi:hypothetical protein
LAFGLFSDIDARLAILENEDMKALKWMLIMLGGLVLLVSIFYAEEDWRGWHAWQKCEREFAAKGMDLNWNNYIPPPVPDEQNVFAAPKMQEWFVRPDSRHPRPTNELTGLSTNRLTTTTISNETVAANYLKWSDQFQPQFDQIREALKRPYARMDGDYSIPFQQPIPDFIAVRAVAQTLAQRAHCHLLLNQPEEALDDMTLMHDLCRLLEAAPIGKPMTLVTAMINVAVTGLYTDAVAEGLRQRAWQEAQLAELQKQFAEVNLTPFVLDALRTEPVAVCKDIKISSYFKFFGNSHTTLFSRIELWLWPRGWTYQNMVNITTPELKPLNGFDLANDTISPRVFNDATRNLNKFVKHNSPYKYLAAIVIPNVSKAWQTTAHNQTLANEAQIACALERYRLVNGSYPSSLDALVPRFIEKLPHDLIGGQPLVYHSTADGKFLLYSIGWNETDDGGQESPPLGVNIDFTKGDWVWK